MAEASPKQKIEELQAKIDVLKSVVQQAQRTKDQKEGELKQVEAQKNELLKQMSEKYGVSDIDSLKSLVTSKINEVDQMVNDITVKIRSVAPELLENNVTN